MARGLLSRLGEGLGKGLSMAGQMGLEEARTKRLATLKRGWQKEDVAEAATAAQAATLQEQEFKAGESKLGRESRERIAGAKDKTDKGQKMTVKGLDELGDEVEQEVILKGGETFFINQKTGSLEPWTGFKPTDEALKDIASSAANEYVNTVTETFTFDWNLPEFKNMGVKSSEEAEGLIASAYELHHRKNNGDMTEFMSKLHNKDYSVLAPYAEQIQAPGVTGVPDEQAATIPQFLTGKFTEKATTAKTSDLKSLLDQIGADRGLDEAGSLAWLKEQKSGWGSAIKQFESEQVPTEGLVSAGGGVNPLLQQQNLQDIDQKFGGTQTGEPSVVAGTPDVKPEVKPEVSFEEKLAMETKKAKPFFDRVTDVLSKVPGEKVTTVGELPKDTQEGISEIAKKWGDDTNKFIKEVKLKWELQDGLLVEKDIYDKHISAGTQDSPEGLESKDRLIGLMDSLEKGSISESVSKMPKEVRKITLKQRRSLKQLVKKHGKKALDHLDEISLGSGTTKALKELGTEIDNRQELIDLIDSIGR